MWLKLRAWVHANIDWEFPLQRILSYPPIHPSIPDKQNNKTGTRPLPTDAGEDEAAAAAAAAAAAPTPVIEGFAGLAPRLGRGQQQAEGVGARGAGGGVDWMEAVGGGGRVGKKRGRGLQGSVMRLQPRVLALDLNVRMLL